MFSKATRHPLPRSGFTLIELLTVIAIIGILAAIIIPTVGAVRNKARAVEGLNQMRQFALAVLNYTADQRNGTLPGPLDANQTFSYVNPPPANNTWRTGLLLTYIHPYLGLASPLGGGLLRADGLMTGAQRQWETQKPYTGETVWFTIPQGQSNPKDCPFGNRGKEGSEPGKWAPLSINSIEDPSVVDTSNLPASLLTNNRTMLRSADKDSAFIAAGKDCPSTPIHGGRRHVAFFDGHVRSFSAAETNRGATP